MSFTVSTRWSRWLTLIWDSPHRSCVYLRGYSPRRCPFLPFLGVPSGLAEELQADVPQVVAAVHVTRVGLGELARVGAVVSLFVDDVGAAVRAGHEQPGGRRTTGRWWRTSRSCWRARTRARCCGWRLRRWPSRT